MGQLEALAEAMTCRFTPSLAGSFADFLADGAPDLAVWLLLHQGHFRMTFMMAELDWPPEEWPTATPDQLSRAAQMRILIPVYLDDQVMPDEPALGHGPGRDQLGPPPVIMGTTVTSGPQAGAPGLEGSGRGAPVGVPGPFSAMGSLRAVVAATSVSGGARAERGWMAGWTKGGRAQNPESAKA